MVIGKIRKVGKLIKDAREELRVNNQVESEETVAYNTIAIGQLLASG